MGSSYVTVPIASHRRRHLAAIMLRRDMTAYDATLAFKAKVDHMIDELLQSYGQLNTPNSWHLVAEAGHLALCVPFGKATHAGVVGGSAFCQGDALHASPCCSVVLNTESVDTSGERGVF